MKKVLLFVVIGAFMMGLASCGRDCVCKAKVDGKTTAKIIVKDESKSWYEDCEEDYDEDEDGEYEYTCK